MLPFFFMISCVPEEEQNPPAEDPRDEIIGTWQCDENSQFYKSTQSVYTVQITKDTINTTLIIISNFYNLGQSIYAKADLENLTLTLTDFSDPGYEITGTGTITSTYETIEWNYDVDDGTGDIDNVYAVYTKL